MDEQLEQQAGRGEGEILPEAEVSPACAHAGAMQASTRAEPGSWRVANQTGIAEEQTEEAASTEVGGESGLPQSASLTAPSEREPEEPPTGGEAAESETGDGSLSQAENETGVPSPVLRAETGAPRDYYSEWQELAEAHPEVIGKELPEDIYQACMQSELPPLRVYESMMLQKQSEQIAALQNEIATLRQNAENTARAPVSAAGGGPNNEPEDLFLKGFNSY